MTTIYSCSTYTSFVLSLQIHNGPPHPSNFGYAYAKRLIDIQNRYVACSHVHGTVDFALLRTVWCKCITMCMLVLAH